MRTVLRDNVRKGQIDRQTDRKGGMEGGKIKEKKGGLEGGRERREKRRREGVMKGGKEERGRDALETIR